MESRDERAINVALEGIEFILKKGQESLLDENAQNPMATVAE